MSSPSISALTSGISCSACDARLDEERHEAKPDAVLLFKDILVLGCATPSRRRHVDFVEGGEDGGGVLRILEALGDGLAQLGHADAFFAAPSGRNGVRMAGCGAGSPAKLIGACGLAPLRSPQAYRLSSRGPSLPDPGD